jgi:vitamin B12 transporter
MWGSGAIGGILSLNDATIPQDLHGSIGYQIGSFGLNHWLPKISYKSNKWQLSHHQDYFKQKNNFPYRLENGRIDTTSNAAITTKNINTTIAYLIGKGIKLSLHHWYQSAYREIPRTTFANISTAVQGDTANRWKINLSKVGHHTLFNMGVAYFDEANLYREPLLRSYGDNRFNSLIGDASIQWHNKNFKLISGISYIKNKAISLNYIDGVTEEKFAIFTAMSYTKNNWNFDPRLRWEYSVDSKIPLVPSLSLEKNLDNIKVFVKSGYQYRLPTINDRYWKPGGNDQLLPESGWSHELGLSLFKNQDDKAHLVKGNIYYRKIKNWIQWGSIDGSNNYRAQNLTEVISKGLELTVNKEYNLKEIKGEFVARYDYTLATNQKQIEIPKIEVGEQLWYIPKHNIHVNHSLQYKHANLWINYNYNSGSTGINSDPLAFHIFNGGANHSINVNKSLWIELGIQLNNIFDIDYELTERRPMPGRNISLNINFKF